MTLDMFIQSHFCFKKVMMKKCVFLVFLFVLNHTRSQNFAEISASKGIDHLYQQFASMGGGAVFFDYDNDGFEDIYITSGIGKDHLYKNLGNGSFSLITDNWLDITEQYFTTGVVSGDIDNDGFRDLFVTTWRGENNQDELKRNLLFINNGDGTFSEQGVNYGLTLSSFSMGAAMLDYNNDGLLDIYTVNYIKKNEFLYDSSGEINGFNHDCYENHFYKNNGDGSFSEISVSLGLNNEGCSLAVMPTDFDKDNDSDIYIANDFGEFVLPNALLKNNFPLDSFTDDSIATNMDVGLYGMGIAYGDYDKDEDFDYYITNLGRNVLINNDGSQNFTDVSTSAGVENTYSEGSTTLFTTGWGTAFLDVNNDTWPDLFVANGRVPALDFIGTGEDDPNKLYINNGDLTFTDISVSAGVNDFNRGRGMVYSDYDKDGDLDILVVVQDNSGSANARTTLYQNQLNPNGSDNKNWSQISLEGTTINNSAIGARVELTVNGEKLIQEVHGQGSHASQSSLVLHFGLGGATNIDEMKVIWSDTDLQVFSNLDVNERYTLKQGGTLNTENNNLIDFSVYPNPVKDNLNFNGLTSRITVKIYSVQGQLLATSKIDNTNSSINLKNYKKGVYLIQIFNIDNTLVKSKLIVKK